MAGRSILYGVPLLLVQLAIGCSPAESSGDQTDDQAARSEIVAGETGEASDPAATADRPIVVAFGDSLFAGYGLDRGEGFAPELERALAAGGHPAQVIDASVSGDTSAAGLQRLDFALDGLARKPELVIVGLGGNDMLRGLEPAATRKNLDAILARMQEREIPAMLTGMLASPNMGPDYAGAFNPIYPGLAKKFDVPLYPFTLAGVIGHPDLLLPDGIHPNDAGVEQIVEQIAPLVAAELNQ